MENSLREEIASCFQCLKCSNGCPAAFAMTIPPHRIIRMLQLEMSAELLQDQSIWSCIGCETCASRCPNQINITAAIDHLKRQPLEQSPQEKSNKAPVFHRIFLESVHKNGRVFELGLIGKYKLKSKTYFQDSRLGLSMFKKGKIKLRPHQVSKKEEIKNLFDLSGEE